MLFRSRLAYHTKITEDVFGEVELSWRLLANVFRHQSAVTERLHGPTQPLLTHLARRTHEALKQTTRLHEDYHVELAGTANEVLMALWESGAAPLARELGLPKAMRNEG